MFRDSEKASKYINSINTTSLSQSRALLCKVATTSAYSHFQIALYNIYFQKSIVFHKNMFVFLWHLFPLISLPKHVIIYIRGDLNAEDNFRTKKLR